MFSTRSRLSARRTKSSQYLRVDATIGHSGCPLAGSTRQPISGKTLRWPFTLELIPKAAQKHPAKPREEILERRLSAKSHCLIQVRSVCNYLKFTITIKDGATKSQVNSSPAKLQTNIGTVDGRHILDQVRSSVVVPSRYAEQVAISS